MQHGRGVLGGGHPAAGLTPQRELGQYVGMVGAGAGQMQVGVCGGHCLALSEGAGFCGGLMLWQSFSAPQHVLSPSVRSVRITLRPPP
jgi:hypothetical protein